MDSTKESSGASPPEVGGGTRPAGAGPAGNDRSKGSPAPGWSRTAFSNLYFSYGGRSSHPRAVVPRVLGWIWRSESYKGPGLTQHVIRRPKFPAQIPRPQPHGSPEPSASGRAVVGPCRHFDLLRRLGAACGLVSARARTRPLGPDWELLCSWVKPEAPSLPLPSFLSLPNLQVRGIQATGSERARGCSAEGAAVQVLRRGLRGLA